MEDGKNVSRAKLFQQSWGPWKNHWDLAIQAGEAFNLDLKDALFIDYDHQGSAIITSALMSATMVQVVMRKLKENETRAKLVGSARQSLSLMGLNLPHHMSKVVRWKVSQGATDEPEDGEYYAGVLYDREHRTASVGTHFE